MTPRRRTAQVRIIAIAALSVTAAACGTKVPHAEVLADAGLAAGVPAASTPGSTSTSAAIVPTTSAGGAPQASSAAPASTGSTVAGGGGATLPTASAGSAAPSASAAVPTAGATSAGTGPRSAAPTTKAAVANTGPATGSPVVIGQVCECSGVIGAVEGPAAVGAKIWASWINDHGGLNGHRVVLYSVDDGGDPSKAQAAAADLVLNKHAIALMGTVVAVSAQGVQSFVDQKQIPVVGGDSLNLAWGGSPMFFPDASTLKTVADGLTHYAKVAGANKAALLYCVEATICSQLKDFIESSPNYAKSEGLSIGYTSGVSLTQPSFTAQCQAAQSAGVDAIIGAIEGASLVRLTQSCSSLGYHPKYIVSALALSNSEQGNPLIEGTLAPSPDAPWMLSSTPATTEFQNAVQQYAPGADVGTFTMVGWTSGKLLEQAIANAHTDPAQPLTTQAVLDGLWQMKNETLGGLAPPLTFVKGQPAPQVKCYYLVQMVNGKFSAPDGSKLDCVP